MVKLIRRQRLRRALGSPHWRLSLPDSDCASFARDLGPGRLARENQAVSRLLFERLGPGDIAEIERRLAESPEFQQSGLDGHDPVEQRRLLLCYGMWLGVASVAAKTGLPAVQPPEVVHSMARGPLAAAGGLYEADMVVDALASAGVSMHDVRGALDFGCSSGRVARVLAAAFPRIGWRGCDPNEQAIAWAQQHLRGVEFFASPQEPPLPIEGESLDLAYAISIWSHFAPELGLRWFDEMHRLIRPGGHLVFTTHGLQSVAYYASHGFRGTEQSQEFVRALYASGAWYAAEFGKRGDWGVINREWGTAFLSPEWLLARLCPLWRVLEFAPGRNQGNQDLYVLQRA